MKIIIKKAELKDLSAIYSLVKELATFENEPNEPTVSYEQFTKDFITHFECLVAESNKEVIAIALYYWGYSTWKGKMLYLDDLVVKQCYRRHKVGSQLFNAIMNIAKKENASRVSWQVLDWNKPAIKMYEKVNADFYTNWWTCKLDKDKIKNYTEI